MDEMPIDLKSQINDLLWSILPGRTTLDEAERIAVMMFMEVEKEWEKAKSIVN